MRFIDNEHVTDPRINLAIEEYALKHLPLDETYLLFYINEPSIIIGKHQNTVEEINDPYVKDQGIHVVRRLSGGGAVYHDLGNLNFSFITRDDGESFHNFAKFTQPVTEALHQLGVPAELSGRNDILVEGKKISGNAQFFTGGRMFSHGTLMFNTNLDDVVQALQVKGDKIASKGIKSIRSRVANIYDYLTEPMSMEQFRQTILKSIFQTDDLKAIPRYQLGDEDWEKIMAISRERYQKWEWNFGESPAFNVQHRQRFPIGEIDLRLHVEGNMIQTCRIFGDFFAQNDISQLEELLVGCPFDREALATRLVNVDLGSYFGKITTDEFLDMVF